MNSVTRSANGNLTVLSHVRIASPCHVPWNSMKGDDHVRHCDQCRLNVYNLSAMSKEAAEQLILEREGRLCISYLQRADGTILTRDCPHGVRETRRLFASALRRGAAVVLLLASGLTALAAAPFTNHQYALRAFYPFWRMSYWESRIKDWWWPPPAPPAPRVIRTTGVLCRPSQEIQKPLEAFRDDPLAQGAESLHADPTDASER